MEPSPYESVPPPVMSEQPPALPPESSDRKKKMIIIAAAAAGVVILLIVAYVLWVSTSNNSGQAVKQTDTSKPEGTGNQAIDEAASILTGGTDNETDLTDTDDAAKADDAIQSAANVGNSLNENNF